MINEQEKKVGEALLAAKVLTQKQLEEAITAASKKNSPSLIVLLLDKGHLSFKVFEKFLASSAGIKATIIGNRKIRPEVLAILPKDFMEMHSVFPIEIKSNSEGKTLILGMVDPLDSEAFDLVKKRSETKVLPLLISLPDFKQTMRNHFPSSTKQDEEIVIENEKADQKIVLIRPGGYEEEIAFQQQQEKTRLKELTRTTGKKEVELEGFSPSSTTTTKSATTANRFIGDNATRFREEVLAKLDLQGSDAKIINREKYTREGLYKEFQEVSLKPLEAIYPKLTSAMKFEALVNALIEKRILNRRDIAISCAISYIFGDPKS